MKYLLSGIAGLGLLLASSLAWAVPCPNLNVFFVENLSKKYTVDHANCEYKWDASNHTGFDNADPVTGETGYDNVLKYVEIYGSTQITAIAWGGYWTKWLKDVQATDDYFDNYTYLGAKGK